MNRLPGGIFVLGVVSFLTDLSSDMIYPLLPVFLSGTLGAGALALGIIEGVAESTASFLKILSGFWTDRVNRRRPFIVFGYGISGLVRPLIAFAATWPFVLMMRFGDRIGKGLRTAPRDALIADITEPGQRGKAYGFHRSMDHAGAVVGPLVAAGLMGAMALSIREVFLLAAIPAVLVILILIFFLKEPAAKAAQAPVPPRLQSHWKDLRASYKTFLLAMLLFTLGNSTDAFILLRLSEAGVSPAYVAVLWSVHHVIKMVSTYAGGRLSDTLGSRRLIISGWIFYALIYAAFSYVDSPDLLIAVFLLYGIYFGLTEPSEKAYVAAAVPVNLRGTAFGYYHFIVGLGALPASLVFGLLWHAFGVKAAFLTGAGLAIAAAILLSVTYYLDRAGNKPVAVQTPIAETPQHGEP